MHSELSNNVNEMAGVVYLHLHVFATRHKIACGVHSSCHIPVRYLDNCNQHDRSHTSRQYTDKITLFLTDLGKRVDEIKDDADGVHGQNNSHHALAASCTLLSSCCFLHFSCCPHARVCTTLQYTLQQPPQP